VKFCVLIAAICLLTSGPVNAQWVETTILLPDSIGGISYPQSFGWCPATNHVYVGGYAGNAVLVVDGATNQRIARVQADSVVRAFFWHPARNRMYCANENAASVTVIDCATNTVAATIRSRTSRGPCATTRASTRSTSPAGTAPRCQSSLRPGGQGAGGQVACAGSGPDGAGDRLPTGLRFCRARAVAARTY